MELYVGMDVSLKQTSICVVDGSGRIVSEGTVISEPAAIAEFIKAKAGKAKRIGLETGPTTTWLWHELRVLGLPVICIDARHAKAALSLQINKSDRWRCRCRRPVVPALVVWQQSAQIPGQLALPCVLLGKISNQDSHAE